MEYFYAFQNWLYQTPFYQDILRKMPTPLNNIYFDSLLAIGLLVYLIYRVIEAARIAAYRRRMRRKRDEESDIRREQELEMSDRKRKVQEKEDRLERFLDYMELLFASRAQGESYYEADSEPHTVNAGARPEAGGHRRIGFRRLFLEKKDDPVIVSSSGEQESSDYDAVMDAYVYDMEQENVVEERQREARQKSQTKMNSLDDELRVAAVDEHSSQQVVVADDPEYEKRKDRARKEEEKERRREEKLLKKQQRKEARHGKLRK